MKEIAYEKVKRDRLESKGIRCSVTGMRYTDLRGQET